MTPLLLTLLLGQAAAAPAPAQAPVLTLDQAVQNALAHQPQLHQAEASSAAGAARADEARAPLLPQVAGNISYERLTGNSAPRPGLVPGAGGYVPTPPTGKSYNYWQSGVQLNQLVWDFNQTIDKWRASGATAEALRDSEQATRLQVVLNVRVAYFTARADKELVQVAQQTLENLVRHREQIEGFVTVGTRSEIDLVQAKTDEANGRVSLIQAQNNYEIAKAQLNQAMGLERSTDYDVGDNVLPPLAYEESTTDALLKDALASRPDLLSAEEQARAADLTISADRGGYLPSLLVGAGLTDVGPAPDRLVWNWTASATLQWNLFQGGLTRAQVEEAQANLAGAQAQEDVIRQQMRLDIDQARLALKAAKESAAAAAEALTNAQERLRLAEGRYQTGVGSIIELGDAQVALTQAAAQDVNARFQISIARAQLAKAVGRV